MAQNSSDHDKAAYSEAGQWVRLSNTVSWSLALAATSIMVGFLAGAATSSTETPRFLVLAIGSFFLGATWVYFDHHYEISTDDARKMLVEIEEKYKFKFQFYKQQNESSPFITLNQMVRIFLTIIALGWVFVGGQHLHCW